MDGCTPSFVYSMNESIPWKRYDDQNIELGRSLGHNTKRKKFLLTTKEGTRGQTELNWIHLFGIYVYTTPCLIGMCAPAICVAGIYTKWRLVRWVRKQRTNKTLSNWGEPSTKRRFHPALLLDQWWGLEKRNGYGVDAIAWGKSRFNAIGFTWFVGGGGCSTTSLLVYLPLRKMWYQVLSFDPTTSEPRNA
jgi:hypothetical protein